MLPFDSASVAEATSSSSPQLALPPTPDAGGPWGAAGQEGTKYLPRYSTRFTAAVCFPLAAPVHLPTYCICTLRVLEHPSSGSGGRNYISNGLRYQGTYLPSFPPLQMTLAWFGLFSLCFLHQRPFHSRQNDVRRLLCSLIGPISPQDNLCMLLAAQEHRCGGMHVRRPLSRKPPSRHHQQRQYEHHHHHHYHHYHHLNNPRGVVAVPVAYTEPQAIPPPTHVRPASPGLHHPLLTAATATRPPRRRR